PTVTGNTGSLAQSAQVLTIRGTGFSTTPGQNTVALNLGAAGTVFAATSTQLSVGLTTAPTAVGSLTAVVTPSGGSTAPAVPVATVVAAPTVTLSTAILAQDATPLIITGTGFDPDAAGNMVTLSSGSATLTAATDTQLTLTLTTPPTPGSLTAVVSAF